MELTHWPEHPPPGPDPHVRALAVNPQPTADDAKKYKRRLCTFWEEVSRVTARRVPGSELLISSVKCKHVRH